MTELFKMAVAATRTLPDDLQDEIAAAMLSLVNKSQPIVELSASEKASFTKSLEQAARGEFASDEEVAAIWAKHGF